jgi:hypothetical protein
VVIEVVKVRQIGLAPPDVHIGYLEVVVDWSFYAAARLATGSRNPWAVPREKKGRTDAGVVVTAVVVGYELHRVARHNVFGMRAYEI